MWVFERAFPHGINGFDDGRFGSLWRRAVTALLSKDSRPVRISDPLEFPKRRAERDWNVPFGFPSRHF